MGVVGPKQKSEYLSDSANLNYLQSNISAYTNKFDFSGPNLPKNCQSKIKKANITYDLHIFQLDSIPNLSLYGQFQFFEPNLSKNGISHLKQKKEHQNHHHHQSAIQYEKIIFFLNI